MRIVFFLSIAMLATLTAAGTANATISGHVVENAFSDLNTPPPADGPGHPSSDFTTNNINFYTGNSPSTTIGTFATLGTNFFNGQNGFSTNDLVTNTDWLFTGQTYLNAGANSFVVGHDDGALLDIPPFGRVVNVPGDNAFSTTPFTVNAATAGLYSFTLNFHENGNGPAGITFQVNGAPVGVPEPATFALLGAGLLGLGLLRRRA